MNLLWNDMAAAEATGGEARGHWHASRVEIDSRKVQLGDLFIAICGERVDGHHYVADALSRGAVAAVVSHIPEGLPRTAPLLVVKDTLEALVAMGRYRRAASKAKIVGVTGSVGKTSTKEMLKLALSAHGKTYATTGNFNNHIGTPLNLANFPADAAFGVFEMGMNHAGEIRHLVEMVRPHVAVITNIEAVHLEFFKDIKGIADAKAEIFERMEAPAVAVLNADNEFCDYLKDKAHASHVSDILTFGEIPTADAVLVSYTPTEKGAEVVAAVGAETLSFTLGATGRHFAKTALAALCVAKACGLPLPKTAAVLADYAEAKGRGVVLPLKVEGGTAWLIDDSYNASPASMKAAIAKAAEVWEMKGKKGRKIAALGNMLELGADAPQLHAGLSEALVAQKFDQLYTAGALMQHLYNNVPASMRGAQMMEAAQLLPLLQKALKADDVLLIKGSNGSKMHAVAAALVA